MSGSPKQVASAQGLSAAGNEGFIEGQTRIKVLPEVTQRLGLQNMLVGALMCIGGTVASVVSFNIVRSSFAGGTYFIFTGAGADGRFIASAISRRDSPLAWHCRGHRLRQRAVLQAD